MRKLLFVAAAGALASIAAGCGSSSNSKTTAAGGPGHTLTVSEADLAANRFAYTGLSTVSGGIVKITYTNAGKTTHQLQLIRIDSGHSAADVQALFKRLLTPKPGPTPDWLHPAGGVGDTIPGSTVHATLNLKPGQYYALDTDSGQGPNSPAYMTQGAFTAFTVVGGSRSAPLPSTSAQVTAKDAPHSKFSFDVAGLKPGSNTITFENRSKKEYHEITAFPLLPGKTAADLKKALASNGPPSGPPPADFMNISGTAVLANETKQVTQLTLTKPGNYVLVCFLSDRDGKGKPHFQEGLFKEVKVS